MTPEHSDEERYSRAPVHTDEKGLTVYRASSLGFCRGALVRSALGVSESPPPERIEEAWAVGRNKEREVLERALREMDFVEVKARDHLERLGRLMSNGQVETEIAVGKGVVVRCHPDGFGIRRADGQVFVIEVKCVSRGYFETLTRNFPQSLSPLYRYQMAVEMLSTDLPCLYVFGIKGDLPPICTKPKRKSDAGTRVHDYRGREKCPCGWDGETMEQGIVRVESFVVEEPPLGIGEIRAQVQAVQRLVREGVVPECDYSMWPCPWWKEHPEPTPIESVEDELLASLAERYEKARKFEKQWKERAEVARDGLLEWFRGRDGVEEVVVEVRGEGKRKVTKVSGGKGNVSWAAAYKKHGDPDADLEEFRGKPGSDYVKVEVVGGEG